MTRECYWQPYHEVHSWFLSLPRSFTETLIMKMFIYIYIYIWFDNSVSICTHDPRIICFYPSELISKWPPRILYNRQCSKEHLPYALSSCGRHSPGVTHRVTCWVIEQVAPPHTTKSRQTALPQWQIRPNFCQSLIFPSPNERCKVVSPCCFTLHFSD